MEENEEVNWCRWYRSSIVKRCQNEMFTNVCRSHLLYRIDVRFICLWVKGRQLSINISKLSKNYRDKIFQLPIEKLLRWKAVFPLVMSYSSLFTFVYTRIFKNPSRWRFLFDFLSFIHKKMYLHMWFLYFSSFHLNTIGIWQSHSLWITQDEDAQKG